jgi:hypothetical protein
VSLGHANTGIVGSNPTRGMHVCLRLFLFSILCGYTGLSVTRSMSDVSQTAERMRNTIPPSLARGFKTVLMLIQFYHAFTVFVTPAKRPCDGLHPSKESYVIQEKILKSVKEILHKGQGS